MLRRDFHRPGWLTLTSSRLSRCYRTASIGLEVISLWQLDSKPRRRLDEKIHASVCVSSITLKRKHTALDFGVNCPSSCETIVLLQNIRAGWRLVWVVSRQADITHADTHTHTSNKSTAVGHHPCFVCLLPSAAVISVIGGADGWRWPLVLCGWWMVTVSARLISLN